MKKLLKVTSALLLLAGGLSLAAFVTWNYLNSPPAERVVRDERAEEVVFEVEQGDSVSIIADKLAEEGLIRSPLLFVLISKVEETQTAIKTGFYRFDERMSTLEIHRLLVAGTQKLNRITIPEGLTARKIGARLEEAEICSQEDFLSAVHSPNLLKKFGIPAESLEGYLFPDTYRFQQKFPAEKVTEHLVDTFFRKLEEIYPEYADLSPEELHRKLIMASIVEREYRDPQEADKIASVFYNRLEENMRLQSCATVVYVLTEQEGRPHPSKLTYADLEVDSIFNTYREWGLPPGPISNPGTVALSGAFKPAETDYLFFLLQDPDDGRHVFSRTLADHNKAYTLYIKQ